MLRPTIVCSASLAIFHVLACEPASSDRQTGSGTGSATSPNVTQTVAGTGAGQEGQEGELGSGATGAEASSSTTGGADDGGQPSISGAILKGPFVAGVVVKVQPLDESLAEVGEACEASTVNEFGEFDVECPASSVYRIESKGKYFDEVTGTTSDASIKLSALFAPSLPTDRTVYVNLVTHLSQGRVRKLVDEGLPLRPAIAQAESELRDALLIGFPNEFVASGHRMNFTHGDIPSNAYLVALSSVLSQQAHSLAVENGDNVSAALDEILDEIEDDFTKDQKLEFSLRLAICEAASKIDVAKVRGHLEAHYAGQTRDFRLPPFERWVSHDFDGDDIPSQEDNCPFRRNNSQLDSDEDGVGDSCDLCPRVFDPDQADSNRDGQGDACTDCAVSCSIYDDPCPTGMNCAPTTCDSSSSNFWEVQRCVVAGRQPKGELCQPSWLGSRDQRCRAGLVCWEGRCVELCQGSEELPTCTTSTEACYKHEHTAMHACLPRCHPLAINCPVEGQTCLQTEADSTRFVCLNRAPRDRDKGDHGDTCEYFNSCKPGLGCVAPGLVDAPGCDQQRCCSQFCSVADGSCPSEQEVCIPTGNTDYPTQDEVGFCILPQ